MGRVLHDTDGPAAGPVPGADDRSLVASAEARHEPGRVNRARADEHVPSLEGACGRGEVVHAADSPGPFIRPSGAVSCIRLADVDDLALGHHVGSVLGPLGLREIVEAQGILRLLRAARAALATLHADPLIAAVLVQTFPPADRERWMEDLARAPETLSNEHELTGFRRRTDRSLGGAPCRAHRSDIEHVGSQIEVVVELLSALVLGWPALIEHRFRRSKVDVGVDERAASVAGCLDADDLLEVEDVPEPLLPFPSPSP